MDGEMKGIDHRMSRGVRELKREKEIQMERSPCGLAACVYFKFVLILGVLVRGRNIRWLSSCCGVCLQLLIFRSVRVFSAAANCAFPCGDCEDCKFMLVIEC